MPGSDETSLLPFVRDGGMLWDRPFPKQRRKEVTAKDMPCWNQCENIVEKQIPGMIALTQ
jgi:hypothetical protein